MAYHELIYEKKNRVAYLTLNRPEKRNALTPLLIAEITSALTDAESDTGIRAVMMAGAGKAFCAGLDLDELGKIASMSFTENLRDSEAIAALFRKLYTHKKLIVSKVQGAAVAGGCGIAIGADIVIADSDHAKFCYSETRIGFIPAIVAVLALRKTRHAALREMLLRANTVSAADALRIGLINHAVPTAELDAFAETLVQETITTTSPVSIELTKKLLWSAETMNLEDAVNFAVSLNALSRNSADLKKGIESFFNKENMTW
jgi:methylglutaconyl-CoA hydratase